MKLKIGIVGPSGSGKTLIANILANEGLTDTAGVKPPYRPTHSVRIVEFSMNNLELRKYSMDIDVQLWEIGGNPGLKSIYPGVQASMDGIILTYDPANESHIREVSGHHMTFVTHSPSGLNYVQCILIANNFRGRVEHGPQKIVGVPPRVRHIALNVDDDPNRLRDEVKNFLAGVAQIVIDQEKANLITSKMEAEGSGDKLLIPKRLTPGDFRKVKDDLMSEMQEGKKSPKRLKSKNHRRKSHTVIGNLE